MEADLPVITDCSIYKYNNVLCICYIDCKDKCIDPCPKCLQHRANHKLQQELLRRNYAEECTSK